MNYIAGCNCMNSTLMSCEIDCECEGEMKLLHTHGFVYDEDKKFRSDVDLTEDEVVVECGPVSIIISSYNGTRN